MRRRPGRKRSRLAADAGPRAGQPPDNAVVLSVDEKTSIKALKRTQLPPPLRQGWAARHTRDYKRHGVFLSKKQLRQHSASDIASWNKDPRPFIWSQPATAIIRSRRRMIARIS